MFRDGAPPVGKIALDVGPNRVLTVMMMILIFGSRYRNRMMMLLVRTATTTA